MLYPKFLQKGNTIGVPAPSSGAYNELYVNRFENAKLNLQKMGYNCILSKNIFENNKARSAPAKIRANELNEMFDNEVINFIMCAAGGEFLVEILSYVNFDKLVKKPKYIQGFSDPTGLLFPITTKYDIATIYGNNFGEYGAEVYDKSVIENLEILKGNLIEQKSYELYENERTERITGLEGYNFTTKVEWKILDNKKASIYSHSGGFQCEVK